jgi:hypothetical protein
LRARAGSIRHNDRLECNEGTFLAIDADDKVGRGQPTNRSSIVVKHTYVETEHIDAGPEGWLVRRGLFARISDYW